jgi:hypothetical protein
MCRNALHPDHSITDRFDQSADHVGGWRMEEGERDCDRDDMQLNRSASLPVPQSLSSIHRMKAVLP